MSRRDDLVALRDAVQNNGWLNSSVVVNSPLVKYGSLVVASYDGSLDAAKALHDAVLPGWRWLLRNQSPEDAELNNATEGQHFANVWRSDDCPNRGDECFATWAAPHSRAWLLAILEALIAQEDA